MEQLLKTVNDIKERVKDYSDKLSKSEFFTRYSLIDPILIEIGWDVHNPDLVIPEYTIPRSSASGNTTFVDYALVKNKKPIVFIEAKKLFEPLEKYLNQIGLYAYNEGVPYAFLTDGTIWKVLDNYKRASVQNKVILDINLLIEPENIVVYKLLMLSKNNFTSDTPFFISTPIGEKKDKFVETKPDSPAQPVRSRFSSTPLTTKQNWNTINDLLKMRLKGKKPKQLKLPDESVIMTTNWSSIYVNVIEWLVSKNRLTINDCPIPDFAGKKRYCINSQPIHPSGSEFKSITQIGSIYIEKNYNWSDLLKNIERILTTIGERPDSVAIQI